MRRTLLIGRVSALTAIAATAPMAPVVRTAPTIPAIQVDGRGHGHGVGMAQDGALAMGRAGATAKQILGQFYPGTTLAKATGPVRVPVFTGNTVEVAFPDGGEIRGNTGAGSQALKVAPGSSVIVYRDGEGTRVKPSTAAPATTTTAPPTSTTSTTKAPATTTTTALIPLPAGKGNARKSVAAPTTLAPAPTSTTAARPQPPAAVPLYSGVVTATPSGEGRIGVTPRNRRYRGVVEITPVAGNALRFVNQVPVETYLRGMGEVRNPNWPAASLQAQAIAARTYALRAMAAGGELCDTQRCQVYIGADAEYAAMDKAVAATAGQVLVYGKTLASAVYSANGGGTSATREEGFGLTGDGYPYLRAAPYRCDDPAPWSVTIALRDVAASLNYRGELTAVEVSRRGPSGRATQVTLRGAAGDATVTGIQFDAALGLASTLFDLRVTTATKVATINGGSVLQAPPEQAAAVAETPAAQPTEPRSHVHTATAAPAGVRTPGAVAVVLLIAVVGGAGLTRRRARRAWHATLS